MSDVITTRSEGGVFEVTLDRPKANAINLQTSRLMGETFAAFRDDPELGVEWPLDGAPMLSPKDASLPPFRDFSTPFT